MAGSVTQEPLANAERLDRFCGWKKKLCSDTTHATGRGPQPHSLSVFLPTLSWFAEQGQHQQPACCTRAAQPGKHPPAQRQPQTVGEGKDHPWRWRSTSSPPCAREFPLQTSLALLWLHSEDAANAPEPSSLCRCHGQAQAALAQAALALALAPAGCREGAQGAAALKKEEEQRGGRKCKIGPVGRAAI